MLRYYIQQNETQDCCIIYIKFALLRSFAKKAYDQAATQKIIYYNERIINEEHGSFVPLIFSTTGGMEISGSHIHQAAI